MKKNTVQDLFNDFLEDIAKGLAPEFKGKLKVGRGHINQPPYFQNACVQYINENFFTSSFPLMMLKEGFDVDSSGYSLKIVYYDKSLKDRLEKQVKEFVKKFDVKRIDYFVPRHHGVGTIITNQKRNLFYVQQKDEDYPIEEYKLCFSLFGGAVDRYDPDELCAAKRELKEELEEIPARLISKRLKRINKFEIINENPYDLTLFEAVLPENKLINLPQFSVKEGKAGLLVRKEYLLDLKFIHNLDVVIKKYLSSI